MTDSPFARPEVRDALTLLRDHGITPDQYATVHLTERWKVDGTGYPDRDTAFAAAQTQADRTGEWAEVWRLWGWCDPTAGAAESWIVEPSGGEPR